jgi:DNA-binding transcriptional MerR regulator
MSARPSSARGDKARRAGGRGDGARRAGGRADRRDGDRAQDGDRGGLLRMRELAEASGVSAGTIKHYLREGLLPEPVKTSRNMAYYPPEFAERIRLINQLQEERFLPLRVIKGVLDGDPEAVRAVSEVEERILERALAGEAERTPVEVVRKRSGVPVEVLDRLADLGVVEPGDDGYTASDVQIVEAISRFRAGGYDERIGFTVYDTLRYKRALEGLVREEVQILLERLPGELDPAGAADLVERGAEPLHDLISALHAKLLVAELRRQRDARG